MDLARTMTAIMKRSIMDQMFNDVGGAIFGITTGTGTIYAIELEANTSPESFIFDDPQLGMASAYTIRPAQVMINGDPYVGFAGFNFGNGAFLVLDSEKGFIRRSSSIASIDAMDN